MKQSLVMSAIVAALLVSSAQADLIVSTNRSVYNGSLDLIEFYVDDLTGVVDGTAIDMLEGTWTASEGATMYLQESFGDFWNIMTNTNGATFPPQSFVNFDGLSSASDPQLWGRTGSGTDYSSFMGSWYVSSPSGNWGEGSLIAKIYVTTAGEVSFSGKYESTYNRGTEFDTTFSSVPIPEPSTLALLACGFIGLLAYAWRKSR